MIYCICVWVWSVLSSEHVVVVQFLVHQQAHCVCIVSELCGNSTCYRHFMKTEAYALYSMFLGTQYSLLLCFELKMASSTVINNAITKTQNLKEIFSSRSVTVSICNCKFLMSVLLVAEEIALSLSQLFPPPQCLFLQVYSSNNYINITALELLGVHFWSVFWSALQFMNYWLFISALVESYNIKITSYIYCNIKCKSAKEFTLCRKLSL